MLCTNFSGRSLGEEQGRLTTPEVFDVPVRDQCNVRGQYEPMGMKWFPYSIMYSIKDYLSSIFFIKTWSTEPICNS